MRTEGAPAPSARRGQALMELAAGMLALVIVASAVFGFVNYIVRSLKVQNSLRGSVRFENGPVAGTEIWLGEGASKALRVEEKCSLPSRTLVP